jgi:hypothetical protein
LRNQFGKGLESSFEPITTTPRKSVLSLLPKLQEAAKKENSIDDEAFLASYLRSRNWPPSVIDTFNLHVVTDSKNEKRVRHVSYAPHENG